MKTQPEIRSRRKYFESLYEPNIGKDRSRSRRRKRGKRK